MNWIFLLILLMVVCDGCKKELKNGHGLKRHRISCQAAKTHTATLLRQRQLLQRNIKKSRGIGEQEEGSTLLEPLIENVSNCQYILS
jgi:hypothetical protein